MPNRLSRAFHIEGYAVRLDLGQRIKVKTNWYKEWHKKQGAETNDTALARAILERRADDIRATYHDCSEVLTRLDPLSAKLMPFYNDVVATVTEFYDKHRSLSRREYASLGGKELNGSLQHGLAMMLYAEKPVDFAKAVFQHVTKKVHKATFF